MNAERTGQHQANKAVAEALKKRRESKKRKVKGISTDPSH